MNESNGSRTAASPLGLPAVRREAFPQVYAGTVLEQAPSSFRRNLQDRTFHLAQVFDTDPSFTELFPYRFIRGSAKNALSSPHNVVLSGSTAERLYPDSNPLGKTLYARSADSDTPHEITGVIEDIPSNTHFQIDALVSKRRLVDTIDWSLFGGTWTYVLLKEGTAGRNAHSVRGDLRRGHERIRQMISERERDEF